MMICPSCRQTIETVETAFGAEISCPNCASISLLTKNHELRLRSEIDVAQKQICPTCGDVTAQSARFCQNGHALLKKCIYCKREIVVTHRVCENCGWQQTVAFASDQGIDERIQLHLTDLSSQKESVRTNAEVLLGEMGEKAAPAVEALCRVVLNHHDYDALTALRLIGKPSKKVVPVLLDQFTSGNTTALDQPGRTAAFRYVMEIVLALGTEASEFIPALMQLLELCPGERNEIFRTLGKMGPIVIPTLTEYINKHKDNRYLWQYSNPEDAGNLFQILEDMGEPAIPAFKSFTGLFSGEIGKEAKRRISYIRDGRPQRYDP
jgi:hypothetical protein